MHDIPAEQEFIRESNLIEGIDNLGADGEAMIAYNNLLKYERLSLSNILETHGILLGRLDPSIAGKLRTVNVRVGNRTCPPWMTVPRLLDGWLMNHARANTEETIKRAHVLFEKVHPFQDGNGRIGRMILNWQRIKAGLPILIIKAAKRQDYYKWFH